MNEIREIVRGLVADWFKGKRTNCVLNRIRQEASVNHEVSEICGQVWQNDRSDGHQNLEFLKFADHIYLGLISTGQNESAEES